MSTKACSQCLQQRPTSDYSGAQLKKKGKRVCVQCITGEESVGASADAVAEDLSAASIASIAADASEAVVVPSVQPTPLEAGTYPPNEHFPDAAPVAYENGVAYYTYSSEHQLPLMTKLIERDLSEPYSVFTYRYFLNFWPHLTFMVGAHARSTGYE